MNRHLLDAVTTGLRHAARLGALVVACGLLVFLAAPARADVSIDPGAGFTAAQEQELRDLVAGAQLDMIVVALAQVPAADRRSPRLHATRILERSAGDEVVVGDRAVLVFSPTSVPTYAAVRSRPGVADAEFAVADFPGTEQERFVALVDIVANGRGAEEVQRLLEERREAGGVAGARQREEQPTPRAVVIGRWVALGVGVVFVAVLVLLRGRAALDWWHRQRRSAGIDQAAGVAEARNLADRAAEALREFGAAIDAQPMTSEQDLDLWRLALDDHAEASRHLDAPQGKRDDRKVVELCRRGSERLRRAVETHAG